MRLSPFDGDDARHELVALRRDLHAHPELGFAEHRTSRVIRERMEQLGLLVQEVAGTGLVATLSGGKPGPTILVRAELDALPIEEQSGAAYHSVNAGVMHACGHDAHCATAVVVAAHLREDRDELTGTVKFAFQPAEEIASGAARMIAEGAMENPRVDAVLAMHVWQPLPLGQVGVRAGAMPHLAIDAIVVASQIVTALQTVVSRTRPPMAPAAFTIGSMHGGTAWNIIADRVEMHGTLRTFDPAVRQVLIERITSIAQGIAASMGARCEIDDRYTAPPVVNDGQLAASIREATVPLVGEDYVVEAEPALVGDDFAHFAQEAPGCMFLVGSSNAAKGLDRGHHDSAFEIDEDCLPIAAATLDASVRGLLRGL